MTIFQPTCVINLQFLRRFMLKLFFWPNSPTRVRAASCSRFLDHTQCHTTVGRTPLYEGSARHRNLYLMIHNTHKSQTPVPPAGFEPAIPASERPHVVYQAVKNSHVVLFVTRERVNPRFRSVDSFITECMFVRLCLC